MTYVLLTNLFGTFVFATSGAALAMQRKFDLFGVLVLAAVTALFGGVAGDILIGTLPPDVVRSWHACAVALAAGLLTFVGRPLLDRIRQPVLLFDALGLGLFAVTGAQKAIVFGIDPPMAALLGMTTGIAGGMLRDLLVARVPIILRTDIYAVAALAGSTIVAIGAWLHWAPCPTMVIGAIVCVSLRLLAMYRHWALPGASTTE